jgi:hypothetical protein
MYLGLHLKCPIFCPILTKSGFSRQIIMTLNIKFRGNQSCGSRADTCERMDRHTDMTKVIGVLRNYAHAPKNIRNT